MKQKLNSKPGLIDYLANRKKVSYSPDEAINLARNHPPFLYQLNLMKKLPVHRGCVNTICWNKTGEYILSGSDDGNLCITKPTYLFDTSQNYSVLHKVQTHHLGNIFSAQFMPNTNDSLLVSSSSDGPVIVHNIYSENPSAGLFTFNCHSSVIYDVVPLYDEDHTFFSCGEDRTIRLFDLRCHRSCPRSSTCPHPPLIKNSHPMTTLALHPFNSQLLLIGRADGLGLVYDRRKLPDVSKFSRDKAHIDYLEGRSSSFKYLHPLDGVVSQFSLPDTCEKNRFTSLCYSADGKEVLASYSQDYVYLFSTDRSSNFELIQTLPRVKKVNPTENTEDSDTNELGNSSSNQSSSSTDDTSSTRESVGGARRQTNQRLTNQTRGPKIRMRGDWSDTGIHSVPYSSRDSSDESERPATVMQRIVGRVRSGSRRTRPLSFIPMADLLEVAPSIFSDIHTLNRRPASRSESETTDADNDNSRRSGGLEGESSESWHDEDNDEYMSTGERDQDEEEEGEPVNFEHDSGAIDSDDEVDVTVEWVNATDQPNRGYNRQKEEQKQAKNKTCRVSSETKEKFRKTSRNLKSRFSKIPNQHPHVCYQGHRNSRTTIKEAIFWGDDYIMSGSDCGRIMIWEKKTAKLVMGFPADARVVNCLAPNPHTYALASSGIDYDIKLWSTQNIIDGPLRVSESEMESIIRNNELMLEESKQTITVPPQLFFRILASFASPD